MTCNVCPLLLTAHCHYDAGDQTANLWWRLQNGEIFTKHAPQVSVVLIGTNDLGAASCGVGEPGIRAAVGGVVSRYYTFRILAPGMHFVKLQVAGVAALAAAVIHS